MTAPTRAELEAVAKAAGIEIEFAVSQVSGELGAIDVNTGCRWCPLDDDGDCLRLANALGLWLESEDECEWSKAVKGRIMAVEPWSDHSNDRNAATRAAVWECAKKIAGV